MKLSTRPVLLASACCLLLFGCVLPKPELPTALPTTIAQAEQQMQDGNVTPTELTQVSLQRIGQLDTLVKAVLETNPDALSIASKLEQGDHKGLLYGIPVLLKDNIDTGDRMLTTAGSLAMTGAPAARDSAVAAKLRAAGAVIVGKTNL